MNIIENNLLYLRRQICEYAHYYGRESKHITLLAVSKTKSTLDIETAIKAGQYIFGESYVQEGIRKIRYFLDNKKDINLVWHFIGFLQTNKTSLVAEYFDWCHSLDRPKIIYRLNKQRPLILEPLNVLIQVKISNELTKNGGVHPNKIFSLASIITGCSRLRLRGLMSIPALDNNFQHQLVVFLRLYNLYKDLQTIYPTVDTLSIGMTKDIVAAIAAGSTLLRVGTAIFGNIN